jgi:hypothetical protein
LNGSGGTVAADNNSPATLEDKMKEPKNREESERAILLAVVVFLVSAVVSLLLNLLFARQSRPAKSQSGR